MIQKLSMLEKEISSIENTGLEIRINGSLEEEILDMLKKRMKSINLKKQLNL